MPFAPVELYDDALKGIDAFGEPEVFDVLPARSERMLLRATEPFPSRVPRPRTKEVDNKSRKHAAVEGSVSREVTYCLEQLKTAFVRRDIAVFNQALASLLEEEDPSMVGLLVDQAIADEFELNPAGGCNFLKAAVPESNSQIANVVEFNAQYLRVAFVGGVQYGPRFRCLKSNWLTSQPVSG